MKIKCSLILDIYKIELIEKYALEKYKTGKYKYKNGYAIILLLYTGLRIENFLDLNGII